MAGIKAEVELREQPQIALQVKRLAKSCDTLFGKIDVLQSQLAPVLRTPEAVEVREGNKCPHVALVPLAGELDDIANRIDNMVGWVDEIRARTEL